jgi:hypothetical protein
LDEGSSSLRSVPEAGRTGRMTQLGNGIYRGCRSGRAP